MIAEDFILLLNWLLLILGLVLIGLIVWLLIFKHRQKRIKLPFILIVITALLMAGISTGYLTCKKYAGVWLWNSQKKILDDTVKESNYILDGYERAQYDDSASVMSYTSGIALNNQVKRDMKYNEDARQAASDIKKHTSQFDPSSNNYEYYDYRTEDLLGISTIINEYSKQFNDSVKNDGLSVPVATKTVKRLHITK